MKIVCLPPDPKIETPQGGDLNVVLYGRTSESGVASAGAAILHTIQRSKLVPNARAWDLLSIALSVVAADTGVRRNESPDGWTRQLELQVAVSDPVFWSSQSELLASQLAFLTTDIWELSFVGGGLKPAPPRTPRKTSTDCVCLLSGGLDSLVGAIDLVNNCSTPYLVSQVSRGDGQIQRYFASQIGGGLPQLQLNHNVVCPGENERSQRARSFVFLAYGTLVATALSVYKSGNTVTLYVCENGYISINPPLTGMRLGSLSTKTTHPVFLTYFQQLLDAAGFRVEINNPYQFRTKGEMLAGCADQNFLKRHAHTSTSCGRFARNGYKHCGRCLPCLIRRASFHAWGEADNTDYVYGDLSKNDNDHARFDDVRSAAIAVAEVQSGGFDRWIRSSLNSTLLGDVAPYKEVTHRGLDELAAFLNSVGVS